MSGQAGQSPVRAPGRPRSVAAGEAILGAAIDLLIERGVDQASVEQVAKRAGVTRATVYRRFPNLTALLVRAIAWEYRDMDPDTMSWTDLAGMVAALAGQLARPRDRKLMRRLYAAVDDYPELLGAYAEANGYRRVAIARETLEAARRTGELPESADPAILQHILSGAALHYVSVHPDDTGPAAIEAYFLDILRQVGYRPARPNSAREGKTHD